MYIINNSTTLQYSHFSLLVWSQIDRDVGVGGVAEDVRGLFGLFILFFFALITTAGVQGVIEYLG